MQVHTEQSSQSTEPLKLRDRHVYIIMQTVYAVGVDRRELSESHSSSPDQNYNFIFCPPRGKALDEARFVLGSLLTSC